MTGLTLTLILVLTAQLLAFSDVDSKANALKELKNQRNGILNVRSGDSTKGVEETSTKLKGSLVEEYYHAIYYNELMIH